MAAKTCSSNLAKAFLGMRQGSRPFCVPVPRIFSEPVIKSVPASLGGASLHSLPGHRTLCPSYASPSLSFHRTNRRKAPDYRASMNLGVCGLEEVEDFTPLKDEGLHKDISEQITKSLEQGEAGRLFAVVYVRNNQFKVTQEDIIAVKYDFPPKVGDRIRLEKVLAVGGKDFTLIGQPLLGRDVVRVEATVVEKTLSHNRVWFVYTKRVNSSKKFHLYREKYTMLVINSIQIGQISSTKDAETDRQQISHE